VLAVALVGLVSCPAADTSPPEIALLAEPVLLAVPGPVRLTVEASDAGGIDRVAFTLEDRVLGERTAAPYTLETPVDGNGTYAFVARARDRAGNEATSAAVTVAADFDAPVVTLTATPGVVTAPGTITLEAQASDNVAVSRVEFFEGDARLASTATTPYRAVVPTAESGTRRFTARAFDAAGHQTVSGLATVQVIAPPTTPPVVTVRLSASSARLTVPAALDLTASVSGGDGGVLRVAFYRAGMLVGTRTATPYTHRDTVSQPGIQRFAVVVTAASGAMTVSNEVVVEAVSGDQTAPTVALAAAPATLAAPGSSTLTATALDDVGVARVEFYEGEARLGSDASAPYSLSVAVTDVGTRTFTARAFDAAGNSATSAPAAVTLSADTARPTVTLSATPTTLVGPGSSVLTVTARDNVGVARVEFYEGETRLATVNSAPYTHRVNLETLGARSFRALAFDAGGNSATSSTVTVRVTTAGDPNSLYVAPGGDDANAGTLERPFRTVGRCASLVSAGARCVLRAGTYRETVTPARSGTAGAPIVFTAYAGERAVVSGADPVDGAWQPDGGGVYRTALRLPVAGPQDTGFFANQVFVGDAAMTEARWPNAGTDPMRTPLAGRCLTSSGLTATIAPANLPAVPEGWAGATVWTNEWYVSRTGTVTGGGGGSLAATMGAAYDRGGYWCFLFGKRSLLDAEREWHYDDATGTLFLRAPGGGVPSGVEVKRRTLAFDLRNAAFVTVQNLTLFAATVDTGDASTGIVLDRLRARYVTHFTTLPPLPLSEQAPGSDNFLVLAAHAHDSGIMLRGTGNTIRNSLIEYSSGNGVLLEGSGHTVENNVVRYTNLLGNYTAGIRLNGSNHRIVRNTVSDTGRDGIAVDWHTAGQSFKNSEIAFNDISRFGAYNNDFGGIYICCSVNQSGTRVHHNRVHDPLPFSSAWEVVGIYTDNGSFNATVDHNLVYSLRVAKPVGFKIASKSGLERVLNNTAPFKSYLPERGEVRNNIFGEVIWLGATNAQGSAQSNNLIVGVTPLTDLFTDPANGDYTLRALSAALEAGAAVPGFTDDAVGVPDAGAFEGGRAAWTAGADWTP
jgi:hypothetical protein